MSSPRYPHLIGKGIIYGAQDSKHHELVKALWALVDKLRKEHMYGEYVLDPREDIADHIAKMLVEAEGENPDVRERTQK